MSELNEIVKEINYCDDNFKGWKYTEILYAKMDWLKTSVCDIEEYMDVLIEVQEFIEKLQKLENGEG
tara:strand:- start:1110 stop:1310 length:201 start_codon:yes stop_codon:yes gene_type:complete